MKDIFAYLSKNCWLASGKSNNIY